jgi:hypothetical protein
MRRATVLVLAVILGGCLGVQEADLATWPGTSIRELQTHPFFSTLDKRVEQIGDGEELWTYSNCKATRSPTVCNPVGKTVVCSGGASGETCCQNQFFVKAGTVERYRPVGRCYTDCSVRPTGRCESAPVAAR